MSIREIASNISSQTTADDFNKLLSNYSKADLSNIYSAIYQNYSHLLPTLIKWYGVAQAVHRLYLYPDSLDNQLDPLLEVWTPQQLVDNLAERDGAIDVNLINKLLSKGVNIKQIDFSELEYINSATAELLLRLDYNKFIVFKLLLQNSNVCWNETEALKTLELIKKISATNDERDQFDLIALNAESASAPTHEYASFLLSLGVPAAKLLESFIKVNARYLTLDLAKVANLIPFLMQNGATFAGISEWGVSSISNDLVSVLLDNGLSPTDLLFALLQNHGVSIRSSSSSLPGSREFEYTYTKSSYSNSLVKFAIERGANVNYIPIGAKETVLERLLKDTHPLDLELIDEVITLCNEKTISPQAYISAVFERIGYLEEAIAIIKRFGHSHSEDKITDFARAAGSSLLDISFFFSFVKLCEEYIQYKEGHPSSLSEFEVAIIDRSAQIAPIHSYTNQLQNSFGFTPLQLALVTGQFKLALKMLEAGVGCNEVNPTGISTLVIISHCDDRNPGVEKIFDFIIEHAETIDVINSRGENFVDNFLRNYKFRDQALEKSNDPLYACFKHKMLDCALTNPDTTYIGISHGDSFWSSGIEAVGRLIMKDFPEVEFRVVTMSMIESQQGAKLIEQFSGWINPGGGDSYPHDKKEFSKIDWPQSLDTEQIYQYILNVTKALNMPTLGMCAGAQNLLLNNHGYLYPLKDYCGEKQHYISYIDGTLAHFQAMTLAQQMTALKTCEFPNITFAGDTAHHYAGVYEKLGNGVVLGAISEDGVPMSYCTVDGLHCATQFHPEHHYHYLDTSEQINHERAWLGNFIQLAKMYHDFNQFNSTHPKEYLQQVQGSLSFCLNEEMCPVGSE